MLDMETLAVACKQIFFARFTQSNQSNLNQKNFLTTASVVTTQAVAYVRVTTGICKYSCWNVWYAILPELLLYYKRHVSESRLPGLSSSVEVWNDRNDAIKPTSNMADPAKAEEHQNFSFPNDEMPLSSIIPAVQEVRKRRPPFVPSVGLPNVIRTPQELMVERAMENCAFKSVLAGVIGTVRR